MALRMRWPWAALLVCLAAPPAWAGAPNGAGVLATLAEQAKPYTDGYRQYEAYVTWPLAWGRDWPSGWRLDTRLAATGGTVRVNGVSHALVSLGPLAAFTTPGGRWVLHGGIRPTLLSGDRFGVLNIGVHIQFTSHLGLAFRPVPGLLVGYRVQHMSNGGIDSGSNPGLNLSTVEIGAEW